MSFVDPKEVSGRVGGVDAQVAIQDNCTDEDCRRHQCASGRGADEPEKALLVERTRGHELLAPEVLPLKSALR